MGYYIQTPLIIGKVGYLKATYGAIEIESIGTLNEISKENMALVIVVENDMFDAAGYIYDDNELRRALPTKQDQRKRTWLLMDEQLTKNLAGYHE